MGRTNRSHCDDQLTLNLRNSLRFSSECKNCLDLTYTRYERKFGLCIKCQEQIYTEISKEISNGEGS